MTVYRNNLPQLGPDIFLTDGGIETTLIFDDGLDLPDFAAFSLFRSDEGREAMTRYFRTYASLATDLGVGIVLETPTWRASADWGARLGYSSDELDAANVEAVQLVVAASRGEAANGGAGDHPVVVSGCIGPRGDGYDLGELMTVDQARAYHSMQIRTFAGTGADMVGAITMTNVDEAIGLAKAAEDAGMPASIAFTVETDGSLPTGQPLAEAIQAVDDATDASPAYYQINCAHPTHFDHVLEEGAEWMTRIRGMRANASTMSHEELDEATELDRGDPHDLADRYRDIRSRFPHISVLGGCCGTDHHHIGAIGAACLAAGPAVSVRA